MPEEIWRCDFTQQPAELLPENGSSAAFRDLLHMSIDDHGRCSRLVVLLNFSTFLLVDRVLEVRGGSADISALARYL